MSEKMQFKFKRVAWMSDRVYPEYDGGAEKVDYMIRELGKKQGLEIDHFKDTPPDGYDLYVLGNNHQWQPDKTVEMVKGKKFTFFRHDPLAREHIYDLLSKAHVVVFPSPGLRAFYEKRIKLTNVMYQPWASIEEEWNIYKPLPKEDYALYIGDLNTYKGVHNLNDYARDHQAMKFKVFGRNIENVTFTAPNISYFGWLPDGKVAETLGKAKYWVQLPAMMDPFPQMTVKAFLSGCEMIVNRNLGCFTYPEWNWNDPENIKNQLKTLQDTFWARLNTFY